MLDVNLTEAVLDGCDFRSVNFDSVRLPNDPQVVLIRDKTLVERAAAALSGLDQDPTTRIARVILQHIDQSLGRDGVALVNLRDAGGRRPRRQSPSRCWSPALKLLRTFANGDDVDRGPVAHGELSYQVVHVTGTSTAAFP
jgi:hypothetical protein